MRETQLLPSVAKQRSPTVLVGVLHDAVRDHARAVLDVLEWWVQAADVQVLLRHQVGQGLRDNGTGHVIISRAQRVTAYSLVILRHSDRTVKVRENALAYAVLPGSQEKFS